MGQTYASVKKKVTLNYKEYHSFYNFCKDIVEGYKTDVNQSYFETSIINLARIVGDEEEPDEETYIFQKIKYVVFEKFSVDGGGRKIVMILATPNSYPQRSVNPNNFSRNPDTSRTKNFQQENKTNG